MAPRCRPRSTSVCACAPGSGSRSRSAAPRTATRRSSRPASCRTARHCCTVGGRAGGGAPTTSPLVAHRTREETKRVADVELLGYAQPTVVHSGGTVDVKVSCAWPEFTAEVIRLGLDALPTPELTLGAFPGRRQDLVGGSYFLAELGEEIPGAAGHTVTLWFRPAMLSAPQCLVAGLAAAGGWELLIGEDRRVGAVRL